MKKSIVMAAALGLFPSDAAAQARIELDPDTSWVLNYDDDSCALHRRFGEPGRQAYLELRQFGKGSAMQVVVASKDFARREGAFKVAFEPVDAAPSEINGFNYKLTTGEEGKLFLYELSKMNPEMEMAYRAFVETTVLVTDQQRELILRALDTKPGSRDANRLFSDENYVSGVRIVNESFFQSETWKRHEERTEREVTGIRLDRAFYRRLFLRTGELHAPMQAMRTCLDELYSHWGIDVEAHKSLLRPALPLNFSDVARRVASEYPNRMRVAGLQGHLRVRLDVSAEGEPTACHLQSPVNDDEFEKVACNNLMDHAKFAPALDSEGRPIDSFFQTSITYRLVD